MKAIFKASTSRVCLLVLVVISQIKAAVSEECKTMDFLQQVADGYLHNHIIQTFSTETQSLCRVKCYLSNLCVSYNYNENNGTCDINDSDQIQHPDDLIVKAGFLHVSTENGCQSYPCPSNSTGCRANFCYDGGYKCLCPSGFTGPNCNTDINECLSGKHNCSRNATCSNIKGSFSCKCNHGYEGDGSNCSDVNECTSGTHNCSANSTCQNTNGSFECVCNVGFKNANSSCIPAMSTELVCEGQALTLSCPTGEILQVKWALYGRSSKAVCRHSHMKVPCGDEIMTLSRVKAFCDGKSTCSFLSDTTFFVIDPCLRFYKYTEVKYECHRN